MKTFKASVDNLPGAEDALRGLPGIIVLTITKESVWFLVDADSRADVYELIASVLGVRCSISRALEPKAAFMAIRRAQNRAIAELHPGGRGLRFVKNST